MCDCVNQTTERLKGMFPEAESIEFVNQELLSKKLFSTVEIKVAGKKKPMKQYLLHSYCPICGHKYGEAE